MRGEVDPGGRTKLSAGRQKLRYVPDLPSSMEIETDIGGKLNAGRHKGKLNAFMIMLG